MADEPTASLDSHNGHAVMELLRQLAKEEGCTVLIVTHDSRLGMWLIAWLTWKMES
jgi:putative ABC transport system ATP-binding protein